MSHQALKLTRPTDELRSQSVKDDRMQVVVEYVCVGG